MANTEKIFFTIRKDYAEQISELANEANLTRSEYIRDVILYHLGVLAISPPTPKKKKQ